MLQRMTSYLGRPKCLETTRLVKWGAVVQQWEVRGHTDKGSRLVTAVSWGFVYYL